MKSMRYFLVLLLVGCTVNVSAAYLKNVPQKVQQPDGTTINCFATGDEYYHWLHDENGFTIIHNRKTGYFVYAEISGDELIPTNLLPGIHDPLSAGLKPGLNISAATYRAYYSSRFREPALKSARTYDNTGDYNNLVIFVRFSNQNEYTESLSRYSNAFNASGTVSMTEYFKEVSKSQLNINTTFYPKPSGTTIVSYQDSHPRGYYQPYSNTNTIGYQGDNQYVEREMTLLKDAALSVNAQVTASGVDYDHNNDGKIDNICFIIQGPTDGWSDLLWPHRWVLYLYNVTVAGSRVYDFNFQLSETLDVSVLCHEMFHSLGAPDLYRYENRDITPVGPWDLMAHDKAPPQHMSAYMKMKYGKWFNQIPTITADGTYTLKPLATDGYAAYKIASPNSTEEFFVIEYRKAAGRFESSIVGSGLIIYRVNSSLEGNSQGPPDEVYVYRQNGTTRSDGNINNATFSSSVGRTEFGDNTNPSDFLSNGNAGGIKISNIGAIGETISFTVGAGGGVNPPRNLTAALAGRDVTLTWEKPDQGTGTLAGFKVFRNQAAIATINSANTLNWSDSGLADGNYNYYVTARYTSPTSESAPSNTVTVNLGTEALPDLLISNPVVNPVNVEPGGTISLSCTLENRGTAVAGNSMLRVYLSLDQVFDSGDRQLASGTMDPLEASMARDISGDNITIPATANIGDWFVLFIADADGTVTETIENNNQASAELTVGNPALNPPRNLVAQVIQATVLLSWMEPEPGGGTLAGYYVYRNGNRIATLTDGSVSQFTDPDLALGTYNYYLTAWYTAPAGESPASNEIAVTVAEEAKPDLTAQNLSVSPVELTPGGAIDIACSILNTGAATAGENEVRLYLSQDQIPDNGDVYLAYGTIDPINAGEEIRVSGTDIALPDELASGTWYAILIVDATQAVEEANEQNNQASLAVKVLGMAPDLLITNMVLFPAIITPTSNVRITFNIANNGTVVAMPVSATFFLSEDEIFDPSDDEMCTVSTRFLKEKANTLMYSGFVMSYHYLPGQYFLIGIADVERDVNESDESNNLFVLPVTLAATTQVPATILESGLNVYPVPSGGNLFIEFSAIAGETAVITFNDMLGRELYRENRIVSESNRIEVNTSKWSSGPGMVRLQLAGKVLTGRFIIN